jgi:hypothetical protein
VALKRTIRQLTHFLLPALEAPFRVFANEVCEVVLVLRTEIARRARAHAAAVGLAEVRLAPELVKRASAWARARVVQEARSGAPLLQRIS